MSVFSLRQGAVGVARSRDQKGNRLSILTAMKVGSSVREQRVKKFMTQEQLARTADISLRQMVRIERNEVEPRFSTILKLAEALGVEPSELEDRE